MPVQFPRGLKGERRNFLGRDEIHHLFYCTFTALLHKALIMNGAGEGNRTLVFIQICVNPNKLLWRLVRAF